MAWLVILRSDALARLGFLHVLFQRSLCGGVSVSQSFLRFLRDGEPAASGILRTQRLPQSPSLRLRNPLFANFLLIP